MKDKYDVIVIGAGNGGLMAALNIASKGKSVLVLESNYISGGLATSFVKGRFEFENNKRLTVKQINTSEKKFRFTFTT